jgi:hypothetical protein
VRGRTGMLAVLSRRIVAWGLRTSSPCQECRAVRPGLVTVKESLDELSVRVKNPEPIRKWIINHGEKFHSPFAGSVSEMGVIGEAHRVSDSDGDEEPDETESDGCE